MYDKSLIFVDNPNVEIVDVFTFKCTKCNEEFNPDDVASKCPKCKTTLFNTMKKLHFKDTFVKSLIGLGIDPEKVSNFVTKSSSTVYNMGICTELSVIIDINFQVMFGSQYQAFGIKDNIQQIVNNNFK